MWLTRLGIQQPVLVTLTLIFISVLGLRAYFTLPRSLDPEVSFETVLVYTLWPGASPGEVETQITNEIEEELTSLSNVKRMTSLSTQGRSVIVIEFEPDTVDLIQAEQDVQSRVNRAEDLPEEAEEPLVQRFETTSEPAFRIALGSQGDFARVRTLAEELADEIGQIRGVAAVDIIGDRDREMWVEVDRVLMEGLGLTLPEIIAAVRAQNRNIPGGEIDTGTREYLVRALGEATEPRDLERITLRRSEGGGAVRVGDVAQVTYTFEEPEDLTFLNGEPCLLLNVQRMKRTNTIRIYEEMMPILDRFVERRGHEVTAELLVDTSHEIRSRIHVLQGSAGLGFLLVAIIIALFVGVRNMLFALVGLPVAFLATFLLIQVFGITLNGISLFALILVIGILVDDAIVVLENISRRLEHGEAPRDAALRGASEVARPVTASVTTTMAAFAPLMLVPGIMGQFIRQIPQVVIFALAASLFEVFFMLPHHVARYGKALGTKTHRHPVVSRMLRVYTAALRLCLRHRWLTLLLLIGICLCAPLIKPGVELFPESDSFPRFSINFELPRGKTLADTRRAMEAMVAVVETLPETEFISTLATAGMMEVEYQRLFGSHYGRVIVLLTPSEERDRSTQEVINALRPRIEALDLAERIQFARPVEGPPSGADVEILLRGESLDRLDALAEQVKEIIRRAGEDETIGVPGAVSDIVDDLHLGKEEIRVRIDEDRRRLYRVATEDIYVTIAAAIEGLTAAEITVEDEDVDIVVRLPEEQRADPADLLALPLRGERGATIRLHELIDVEFQRGFETVRHHDGERSVTVTGTIDHPDVASSQVYGVIEPKIEALLAEHPGYTFRVGGAEEETRESMGHVFNALGLGLFLIYFILAAQFQSFVQPFIIMVTIPFAALGVMFGLWLSGDFLTFPTMIGIVALAGIVVNDSLVLIDFINRSRRRQGNRLRAVIEAGRRRMRPVVMTSVTTIGGLLPMVFGLVGNPGLFKPMAVAVCWGLGFATFLVLLVIPIVYLTFDDAARLLRRLLGLREPSSIRHQTDG